MELLSATLGLIAVVIGTCLLATDSSKSLVKKIFSRFGTKGGKKGVDRDLEEYYMQIKNDFEFEENNRSEIQPDIDVNTSTLAQDKPKKSKKNDRQATKDVTETEMTQQSQVGKTAGTATDDNQTTPTDADVNLFADEQQA